ncbi:MAG: 50S ribosomal protein L19 [bacterium]
MDLIGVLEKSCEKKKHPEFEPGATIKVHVRVLEAQKERVQVFEGVVVEIRGTGTGKTFTVRKVSSGIGVERIFPYHSPAIKRVEVIKRGKTRRAKLFYLRPKKGKAAQVRD